MNVTKLREIFAQKYLTLQSSLWDEMRPKDWTDRFQRRLDETWTEYLNSLDCTIVSKEEIVEDFEDIINHSAQGRVCVHDDEDYILVPRELAEKALVLGGLPGEWCPERC